MPPPVERVSAPQLIDDAAKMYIDVLLQKSHEVRLNYNYQVLNISVVILFLVVFGGFLYYRYRTKPSSQEANYKIMKDQEFVVSKIRWYKEQNEKINQTASPITGLPALDSNDWSASTSLDINV